MGASAINRETDRSGLQGPSTLKTTAEVPLDFLVNALNRAVLRRQATDTEEIEHRT